jgi:predicted membrane protein
MAPSIALFAKSLPAKFVLLYMCYIFFFLNHRSLLNVVNFFAKNIIMHDLLISVKNNRSGYCVRGENNSVRENTPSYLVA